VEFRIKGSAIDTGANIVMSKSMARAPIVHPPEFIMPLLSAVAGIDGRRKSHILRPGPPDKILADGLNCKDLFRFQETGDRRQETAKPIGVSVS
jgi:hypothetical protein